MGPANPQALNRYSYVQNNPLKYTDPTGHYRAKGDSENGYETICGKDGQSECTGANDFVDPETGKKYARVWVTENGKTYSKIVEEGSTEYNDFDAMLDAFIDAKNALMEAAAVAATAAVAAGFACTVPSPVCAAAATAAGIAAAYLLYTANEYDKAHERLRKTFVSL